MTGVIAALCGGEGSGSGGGTLGPLSWARIYGAFAGSNAPLTIAGITSPHTLTAANSGDGTLSYILNGMATAYTGGFAVSAGNTLAWLVAGGPGGADGTVTVSDASNGGATVGSFYYILTGNDE